jgi:multidrug efflux pump subunit AcrA (membrane-fusion protein)
MTQVSEGQQCRIEVDAILKKVYQGKVVRLSPVADAATGFFRAYIEIELPEKGLRPLSGMTTSVRFLAKD